MQSKLNLYNINEFNCGVKYEAVKGEKLITIRFMNEDVHAL